MKFKPSAVQKNTPTDQGLSGLRRSQLEVSSDDDSTRLLLAVALVLIGVSFGILSWLTTEQFLAPF